MEMSFEKPLKERIILTDQHENINKKERKNICLSWESNPPTKMLTIANSVLTTMLEDVSFYCELR